MPRPPQDRKNDKKSSRPHRNSGPSKGGPGKGPRPDRQDRQDRQDKKPAFSQGGKKPNFSRTGNKPSFGSGGGKPTYYTSNADNAGSGGQARPSRRQPGPERLAGGGRAPAGGGLWLYGAHAVRAALANPKRKVIKAVLTERAAAEIGAKLLGRVRFETLSMDEVGKHLPPGAVHQGVAIQCEKLPKLDIEDALPPAEAGKRRIVLVLDQITDPHNAGAILRTAAAFGVSMVIVQDRHAPPESGVLAKAASGALDVIPYVEVVNISRALETLGKLGFWRVALAGDGDSPFAAALDPGDIAIVVGSEGDGVRRLVRETCDTTAFIPIDAQMESLNVSNAAAIALYELRRS